MPVIGMTVGQRPLHSLKREATRYMRIVKDITVIVIINELIFKCLPKYQPGGGSQQDTNHQWQDEVASSRRNVVHPKQCLPRAVNCAWHRNVRGRLVEARALSDIAIVS